MIANQPLQPYPEVVIPLYQPLPNQEDYEVDFPIAIDVVVMPYIEVLGEEFVYAGIVYSMKMGRDLEYLSNQLGGSQEVNGERLLQLVNVYKGLHGRMAYIKRQVEAHTDGRLNDLGLQDQLDNEALETVSLILNAELEIIKECLEAPQGLRYKQMVQLENRLVRDGQADI